MHTRCATSTARPIPSSSSGKRHPGARRRQADRPIHRTGVEVRHAEAPGQLAGGRRLAGPRRAVKRDDQRLVRHSGSLTEAPAGSTLAAMRVYLAAR